jgi:5-methylthioadenosine/S-adenosylhomocysteine deaminase
LFDLLVTNGTILTQDRRGTIVEDGAVGIEGNRISAVGKTSSLKRAGAKRTVNAGGGVIIPGLINTHTHLFQSLFKGLGDDVPLFKWFGKALAPYVSLLTEEDCYAAAMLGCLDAIKSGTTCLNDFMYVHPRPKLSDVIIRAMSDIGIRGVFSRGLVDSGRDHGIPEAITQDVGVAIEDCERVIETYQRHANGRISVWVAPASLWMSTPEAFKRAKKVADDRKTWLTWHASETRAVVAYSKRKYGTGDIDLLGKEGILDQNVLAAHCVWIDDKQINLFKETGTKIAHCSVANMYLGDGVAPVPKMLEKGVTVSLGTDGAASNNNQDMIALLKFTALLHKVHTLDSAAISAQQVLELATVGGARSLGLDSNVGSIEVGKKADLVVIDLQTANTAPVHSPVSSLVYAATQENVRSVIIDGKLVMQDRLVKTVDEKKVIDSARRAFTSLEKRV